MFFFLSQDFQLRVWVEVFGKKTPCTCMVPTLAVASHMCVENDRQGGGGRASLLFQEKNTIVCH